MLQKYRRLEIRNRIFYGEQVKQILILEKSSINTMVIQSFAFMDQRRIFVAQSVIDRMLIQYSDEKWDITIGRQRINWGINNIWNPNDIFNAYNFLEFDYEERPGRMRFESNVI